MSRLQAIKSAERSNSQLGKLFNQLGTADHPRGKILLAYRQAHRALRDALQREAFQEVNEIMGFLEIDIGEFASKILKDAAGVGFETSQRQLGEYGVDSVGWEDPGIAYMQDVWMNQIRDQAGRANALLLTGGDPGLVLGSPVRKGIVRPDTVISSGVRWLGIAAATSWKNTTTRSAERAGVVFLRQAIAAIDEKTTDCCLEVHGQTVGLDEPFHLTGSPRFADEIKDPPFHDYCRTSQALVRPSEANDDLTQQMKDAASLEMEYREEQAAKIAEVKRRLAELGAAPDGRARATDTEEIRKLREQLKATSVREPLSPASALSRRVRKIEPEKRVPGERPPGVAPEEVALAPAFVGWNVEDRNEAQELAKKIRRHKRKWERGEISTEQFMARAGDLIAKHQDLSEKYGGESRFMVLVRTKVPPSLQPTLIKPTPTGKADFGGVREQYLSLMNQERDRTRALREMEKEADRLDKDYIHGRISYKEFSSQQTKTLEEIAKLKRIRDKSIQDILKLPEGVDKLKLSPDFRGWNTGDERKLRKTIKILEDRMADRGHIPFDVVSEKGRRSCWDGWAIRLGDKGKRTVHHEVGHVIEDRNPQVRNIVNAWRKHRTKGETAKPMGLGFDPSEITKRDKFVDPYIGRIYARSRSTEVVSMGLELLLNSPQKLLNDPEHFDLMVNIMRGTEVEWAEGKEWYKE